MICQSRDPRRGIRELGDCVISGHFQGSSHTGAMAARASAANGSFVAR